MFKFEDVEWRAVGYVAAAILVIVMIGIAIVKSVVHEHVCTKAGGVAAIGMHSEKLCLKPDSSIQLK